MARLFVLVFFAQIALAAMALISCLSAEDDEIRALPRLGWVLIILLLPVVGPIIWFYAGRPVATAEAAEPATGPGWVTPSGRSERQKPRPIAPDDDPEFLRSLGRSLGRRPNHPADGASAQPDDGPATGPDADPEAGTDPPEDRRLG
jgi:Phospholipase_D-nuclease N-terminal